MILNVRDVYLDHNATSPVAKEVRRAMDDVLEQCHGNPSSLHTRGRTARGLIDSARGSVAALLGCMPEQIIFTSGGTEGNNAILKGVYLQAARARGASGCHVVTSKIEHDSVLGACAQIEEMGGRVTYLSAARDGRVRAEDVKAAIGPDTVLISIMHANNETGAIQPVEEIGRIARLAGVPFHTDAVQSYGKIPTNVDAIGCDFLTLTAHKLNGPKGVGAIYWRKSPWVPLISGGDQERRMRTGTEGVHQIVGLGKAAELAARRMKDEQPRLEALRAEFLAELRKRVPGVGVHEAPRGHQLPGTMNLMFPGHESIRLLAGLDCYEVSVSVGSACTADRVEPSHVLVGMGLSDREALSSIRLSMGVTTTRRDLRYALDALEEVLEHPPAGLSYLDPQHLTADRIRSADTFLVDLRLPHERLVAPSIPSAKEWSVLSFDRNARQIPAGKEAILMCGTGVISYAAGYRLANAGHPRVRVVQGGYSAWSGLYPRLIDELKRVA